VERLRILYSVSQNHKTRPRVGVYDVCIGLFNLFADALQLEDVFHGVVEVLREEQGQRQGGDVVALFHGANGLAADADGLCEMFLRDLLLLAEVAKAVINGVFLGHNDMYDDKDSRRRWIGQEELTR